MPGRLSSTTFSTFFKRDYLQLFTFSFTIKAKQSKTSFFLQGSAQIDIKRPIVKKRIYYSQKLRRGEGRHVRETLRYEDYLVMGKRKK